MKRLTEMYHPITSTPFMCSSEYREILPCQSLKPYVRCFWEASTDSNITQRLVIPDTCIDIIFNINNLENKCSGFVCGIDEYAHNSNTADGSSTKFGIRFYAWTAILFSERNFIGTKNSAFCADEFYSYIRKQLEPILSQNISLDKKVKLAESILLKNINENRINNNLMNALYFMMTSPKRTNIAELCSYTALSERSLERLFSSNIGISPKSFSSLIRYQMLWQEIIYNQNFNILDAVLKYGYYDQSHLLNDFKSRHLLTPSEALSMAKK